MNIGEKITQYKDKLGFKNYQEFGKAAGVSGDWLLNLSKQDEIKLIDMNNLIRLCNYLGVTIDQLVKDDENKVDIEIDQNNANVTSDTNNADIGNLIDEMSILLDNKVIKLNGILLNDKAKQICKDSLEVVKILTRQYL